MEVVWQTVQRLQHQLVMVGICEWNQMFFWGIIISMILLLLRPYSFIGVGPDDSKRRAFSKYLHNLFPLWCHVRVGTICLPFNITARRDVFVELLQSFIIRDVNSNHFLDSRAKLCQKIQDFRMIPTSTTRPVQLFSEKKAKVQKWKFWGYVRSPQTPQRIFSKETLGNNARICKKKKWRPAAFFKKLSLKNLIFLISMWW